ERMFFEEDNSSGVSGDLESATMISTYMEGYWGMGTTVASHGVTHSVGIGGGGRPGGGKGDDKEREKELLDGSLGTRIEERLGDLLGKTRGLLTENRAEVLTLAYALETNKTLTGEDVRAVVDRARGPLVDGRPLYSPEFLQALEEYHVAAVHAHRDVASVAVPMPRPPALPAGNGHPQDVDEGELILDGDQST